MRLIIKDYLVKLKEKDELDLLLCDLLLAQGYITDNVPKTGNRQYGVDIQVHTSTELLLCVVKQGNVNRTVWDGNENAVRASLNEVRDVYLRMLNQTQVKKKIRIAVVTNGYLDEAVRPNWESYIEQNQLWNGKKIEIEFWNIDKLVDDVQKYLMNEFLFGREHQSLLRKALYFIGESDYKNIYFEKIIDAYLERIENTTQKKQLQKEMASLLLATQMIARYAEELNIYKIGIMVNEYLLIRYWKLMLKKQWFEKSFYVEWLLMFCKHYENSCERYFQAVKVCCDGECEFPGYNLLEQRVLLYEMLGYLASYAFYETKTGSGKAGELISAVINAINCNVEFYCPPYDGDAGILNLILRVLQENGRYEDMKNLVSSVCCQMIRNYRVYGKYPTPTDCFTDAANIEFGNRHEEYKVSGMWAVLLEWIAILEDEETYGVVQEFLKSDLQGVTECAWFLRAYEEALFYEPYAMQLAGEGIALDAGKDLDDLIKNMNFIFEQYKQEKFSYETYSFEALEMITCRYFHYIPRTIFLKKRKCE